jgi:hypothetical protein
MHPATRRVFEHFQTLLHGDPPQSKKRKRETGEPPKRRPPKRKT